MQAVSALASQHGITLPITAQARAFLDALWLPLPAGSLVGITASDVYQKDGVWKSTTTPAWSWLDDFRENGDEGTGEEALLVWAAEKNTARYPIDGGGSIYFHPAARKHFIASQYRKRGGLDDLTHLATFYADVDVLAGGLDPEATLKRLLGLTPKPSIILWSGGGWQVYYLLNEAWDVSTRGAAVEYKAYARALFAPIKDIADPSVYEASREMRLPGFINRKAARNGAVAQLVYWSPDTRYSIDQIKEFAPIPPKLEMVGDPLPRPDTPDGTYRVGQDFIHYAVNRNRPPERHPILLQLALQAARGGMPKAEALPRLRTLALEWYRGEEHRAEQELDNLTRWSYDRLAETGDEDTGYTGSWLVRLTDSGWEQVEEEIREQVNDRTVKRDAPKKRPTQPLAQVRAQLREDVYNYLRLKARRIPSLLLLRSSPGAGKSHTSINALADITLDSLSTDARIQASFLAQFKEDEYAWQKEVTQHGADPSLFAYFVGRNEDENSAGYCALFDLSVKVAEKGYHVRQQLCSRCPALTRAACESKGYLSQYKRVEEANVLLGRHQHGTVDELIAHRKINIFDESPLNTIAAPLTLTIADLVYFGAPVVIHDQYPEVPALIQAFVDALQSIVKTNPVPVKRYTNPAEVMLGGRWLFVQLSARLSADQLQKLFNLDPKLIEDSTRYPLSSPTEDAVNALPIYWITPAWSILKYEYERYWLTDTTRWNSRIVVCGNKLSIYRMEPFVYPQSTKIVVTDATAPEHLYPKAFGYKRQSTEDGVRRVQILPRVVVPIEYALDPLSKVVQFTGSDNSRRQLDEWRDLKGSKDAGNRHEKSHRYIKQQLGADSLQIKTSAGTAVNAEQVLDEIIDEASNTYLLRIKALITDLAKKHEGSLLVVSYMSTINNQLKKWNEEHGILAAEHLQYFGNLRGKNEFKDLNAVLIAGTPRIAPSDLATLAQVWYWQDDIPIDPHTKQVRILDYEGYTDPTDGLGRGYQYIGYADDRVNALYVDMVAAEMRQSFERIRANASYDAQGNPIHKFVYIASAFPCADHVDVLQSWSTWWIDHVAREYYETRINEGLLVHQGEFIKHVMQIADCSYNTAKNAFIRIHKEFESAGISTTAAEKKLPIDIVLEWLAVDPARLLLSIRKISEATGQSKSTVHRAVLQLTQKSTPI